MKNNVLDLTCRLRQSNKKESEESEESEKVLSAKTKDREGAKRAFSGEKALSSVLSLTERRQKELRQERRQVKRSLLKDFIRLQSVVPQKGLLEVFLQDISIEGVAFDTDEERGHFRKGERVALRMYITQDIYFPFTVCIRYIKSVAMGKQRVFRHGASYVKSHLNKESLIYFAKFIESATTVLRKDTGDLMVSQLF